MTIKLLCATILMIVICEQSFGQVSNADNSTSQKRKKISIPPDANKKLKTNTQSSDLIKSQLKGVWANGTTENATFEIKENTIFYVDNAATCKYSLQGNKMTVTYPDYTYKCVINFHKDTLIMDSKEYGSASFWKFKKKNK